MEPTELLRRVHAGGQEASKAVIPLLYEELKKLASAHLQREGRADPLQSDSFSARGFSPAPSAVPISALCGEDLH